MLRKYLLLASSAMALVSAFPSNTTQPGTIPGTTSHYSQVRGHNYHYLLAEPDSGADPKDTILLLHGMLDNSYGWRYQIPMFTKIGYRVIAPDLLGYYPTDSPKCITNWAHKELATDMLDLVSQIVPNESVIVGGHDWGAGLTYKLAIWYPELVKAFFTIAVPYLPPWLGLSTEWKDMSELVADGTFPTLGYQLQWRDPSISANFTTPSQIRIMLNTVFGGVTPDGQSAFNPATGFIYDLLPLVQPGNLLTESEMDFYVQRLAAHGTRGAFNWYRTREMDWDDELPLAEAGPFKYRMPSLFIPGSKDYAFPKRYYENVGQYYESLTIKGVDAGHFAQWEAKDDVNKILEEWIASLN